MKIQQHPHPQKLAEFARGLVSAEEAEELESHVADCDKCCQVVASADDDRLIGLAREAVETFGPIADTTAGDASAAEIQHPLAESESVLEPPDELTDHPRYQILGLLGHGGMGTVFKAEHRLMKRHVALKLINRSLMANEAAVQRFRQEVAAAASLSHPNIVAAYDAERAGDMHFLVMEFVEGTSLDRLVAESGPLPIARACDFVLQAAAGLQHAHDRGMVHRDIKPQNLIVTAKSMVKVLDFGLARLADELTPGAGKLTQEHVVLGTPDFIAPEQVEDSRVADARSDIYSLGCTLYYLLAARVPFPVDSSMMKLSSHLLVEPKPLSALRSDVPPSLTAVIEKMMAKEPSQRFQNTAEVREALQPFLPAGVSKPSKALSTAAVASAGGPVSSNMRPGALLGGVVILVLLLAAFILTRGGDPRPASDGSPAASYSADDNEVYVLFLLAPDWLWFDDYGPVHELLEHNDVTVTVASSRRNISVHPDSGGAGVPVIADRLLHELGPWQYDIIVLCGGTVDSFCDDSPAANRVREILHQHLDQKMFLAAICQGQQILAEADLLRGVECAKPAVSDWGAGRGILWNDREPVIKSGHIITASDPDYAKEFAMELLGLLGKR